MKRILSILAVIAMLITMCAAVTLPAVAESNELVNLFDLNTAQKGTVTGKSESLYYTTPFIDVVPGDTLYFGINDVELGYQLYLYTADSSSNSNPVCSPKSTNASKDNYRLCEILDSFPMAGSSYTWGVMSYTIPEGFTRVKVSCRSTFADQYLLTKNQPFTNQERLAYFGLDKFTTNLFVPLATQGYYKNDGTLTSSTNYYSGELISMAAGDTVYFGPYDLSSSQNFVAYFWAGDDFANHTQITKAGAADGTFCSTAITFPKGQVVFAYTAAEAGRIGIVAHKTNHAMFIAAKNIPLTAEDLYEYWDLHSNTITDYSSVVGRYDNVTPKESVLNGKSVLFTGDSICAAAADDDYFNDLGLGGWSGRIKMNYGLGKATNNGVSGAALSTTRDRWYNAASGSTSKQQGRIYWQIASENKYLYDYVILHGGTNDAWDNAPVGEISDSFELEDFDLSTYAGGLEATIYYAVTQQPEAAIGYVMNFAMPNKADGSIPQLGEKYFSVGKKICEKWGIPYLDLHTILNAETFDTNIYTKDAVHPNAAGYNIIAPLIAEWMETLTPYTEIKNTSEKTVIACVGDSLTKGEQSGDLIRNTYPAYLQEMLGDEYEVYNYGYGGAAAQKTASNSYRNTYQYKESMITDPDQVIIMLGANDAKTANWDSSNHAASAAAFKENLKEIVEGYRALPSNPTIYLAKTPWSTGDFRQEVYTTGGLLAAVEDVAAEYGLELIDAYTPTVDKADTLFASDGTHLNPTGYKLIADLVYKAITDEETAPAVPSALDKEFNVAETNEEKPLIRNWKNYPDATTYRIETVEDVEHFGDLISAGVTFQGKTVYLENDLDFAGIRFKPLGATSGTDTHDYTRAFRGTFDGQQHVFSNVYITDYMYSTMGLFPVLYGATIKNFGLDGGRVEGYSIVGAITAYGDYGTVMENVWSSADVFAPSSAGGIAGNMRQNGAPDVPKMKNVACYGTISGNSTVYGIAAWGQTSSLKTENIVFGGKLFIYTKTADSNPFVRYGSTGRTGLATGYYAANTAEQRTVYVDDVTPVLFEEEEFTDGSFVYYMNNLEGNDTKWTLEYGYAVPWGDESDAGLRKVLVNGKAYFTGNDGLLPADILAQGSYWYGTDGKCYPLATASTWILNDGDSIQVAVSAAGADFDNDGAITTADVVMLLRYIDHRDATLTEAQADVNADGKTVVYDAVWLLQVINNMAE